VNILLRLDRAVKPIADPGFGEDVPWAIGIELNLLSQFLDEHSKMIDLVAVVGPPDCPQKLPV
jgi:hypothetical protein